MSKPRRTISFTISCYRSEHTIEQVINEIIDIVNASNLYDYEIICVNDCSPDNVIDVLKRLSKNNSHIKVIDMARNSGKHAGLLAAYHYVTGEYVVAVDDDGESPIQHLWELIDALDEGADVAIARYTKREVSGIKRLESSINDYIIRKLMQKPKGLVFSNFIARKRFVCDYLMQYCGPYPNLEGATLSITRNIVMIDMPERARISGKSGFTFIRGFNLFINGCTTYSYALFHFALILSIACIVLAFVHAIILILNEQSLYEAIILILFSFVFFFIYLLGEYVGRAYMNLNSIPQYVIRKTYNC
ncbi:MAG: glycosyltransferase [Atopobiaceae bacterium]|nr:glycosyltransferase [Atopobiaceae bacterium]